MLFAPKEKGSPVQKTEKFVAHLMQLAARLENGASV